MRLSRSRARAGFTLLEMLIGLSLSLMIMAAVLSSYVFLGRNFTRSLGISSFNQPTLEAQGRRTLAYFAEDVRMTSSVGTTLPTAPDSFANQVKLNLPTGAGLRTILYYFNGTTTSRYLHSTDVIDATADANGVELPAGSLVRVLMDTRDHQVLHFGLLSCTFNYYDSAGQPYSVFDSSATNFTSLAGIKQISVAFTSQGGTKVNGTLTQVYTTNSPRLLLRNKTTLQ